MNKFVLLLVVIGLVVAGWMNRETISGWTGQRSEGVTETEEATPPAGPGKSPATPNPALKAAAQAGKASAAPAQAGSAFIPNPAQEAVAQARRTYPALGQAGSAFNLRFVALYNETKAKNPNLLSGPSWPMQLAERTAKDLGVGTAAPRSGTLGITGWTENYSDAVESAKLDNKKLLLDFTGSDWCGYCMALDKEVLSTPRFQAWARANVVLVRLDFPKNHLQNSRVKDQNAALKARYPFDGYPTIMIVDTTGRVLGRYGGYNPGSGPDAYIAKLDNTLRR